MLNAITVNNHMLLIKSFFFETHHVLKGDDCRLNVIFVLDHISQTF